ncbi:MAG: glycosyltransferase [Bacteroidota bacterium]
MHIAVLSDPNNFHTQKWVRALQDAGADATVFSFEENRHSEIPAVTLPAPYRFRGRYSYLSYLRGGKVLNAVLQAHRVDLINALNITPFGVWAMRSQFRPLILSALGADILEYPPTGAGSPVLEFRSWSNISGDRRWIARKRHQLMRRYYRRLVAQALRAGDLITGDNQYLIDCMEQWFAVPPAKLKLLRWGVEEKMFAAEAAELTTLRTELGLRAEHRTILSPRGAKAIYQGDIILAAFTKLLADRTLAVQCIMLSSGYAIDPAVKQAAQQLAARDSRFVFVDQALPREKIYTLWNLVDVFISAPIYDGYSAAVAEGRYIGAVPVLNDIPATRELFVHGENGWICDPFTPEQLADDLGKILRDLPRLKEKFARTNRAWILEHSRVKNSARMFLKWSENLLSSPQKPN